MHHFQVAWDRPPSSYQYVLQVTPVTRRPSDVPTRTSTLIGTIALSVTQLTCCLLEADRVHASPTTANRSCRDPPASADRRCQSLAGRDIKHSQQSKIIHCSTILLYSLMRTNCVLTGYAGLKAAIQASAALEKFCCKSATVHDSCC